ncbi:MAG: hypothetical protein ABS68_00245 [Niastella sp. SCN 39-18]|nr:hypothetical protein [Sphingobacteriales bacterium]ODT55181.1 MAG: hypothetical protein ABS68_00245 [Niastella sp. SCN 39-18]OJW09107.1 MAG: hypothetical protein BGO53_00160 [Sphingobacteriales bacterium 39-19]
MNKDQAAKVAAPFFKTYPTAKEFHVTSDEQVFEVKVNADNHAKSLGKDKDAVISILRNENLKSAEPSAKEVLENKIASPSAKVGKGKDKKANEKIDKELEEAKEALAAIPVVEGAGE